MSPRSACYVYDWVSRSADFPKRPCLPFEPELVLKEEGSKNHEQSWNPITPFLTHVTLLCLPTIYAENDDLEGKEKIRQPTVLFPFSPSLLFSRTMLVECVHVEKWKKSQVNVCRVSTDLLRTKDVRTYGLWNMNCTISVILHTNSALLYLHLNLALCTKHGKICANSLKF